MELSAIHGGLKFQSPDGDFVYSDAVRATVGGVLEPRFNPLTGISSILTKGAQ